MPALRKVSLNSYGFTVLPLSLAYEFIDLKPEIEEELGILCASANLLNASLNKNNRAYEGGQKLPKEIYSFKGKLKVAIEHAL